MTKNGIRPAFAMLVAGRPLIDQAAAEPSSPPSALRILSTL